MSDEVEATYIGPDEFIIDHADVGGLVGQILEILEVLPSEQSTALKKIVKKTIWEWKDYVIACGRVVE